MKTASSPTQRVPRPGFDDGSSGSSERGSALLIVFLFAAIVAITLYMEMPIAVFEAQRQKEQLLVDRGNEYAHAVKLYYRKFGAYPPSIEALENTNRMRFLRHKFKDPFTGKTDWRLLHAGPGGILIDSKVKPLPGVSQNGQTNSTSFGSSSTTSSSFGASSTSGFGNSSSFASNQTSTTPPDVMVAPLPQRPPAVSANGAGQPVAAPDASNPMTPLLEPGQVAPDGTNPSQQAGNPNVGLGTQPAGQPAGQQAGQTAEGQPGMPVTGQPPANTMATGTDSTGAVRNLLTNPNPLSGPGAVQAPTRFGTTAAGATGTTGVISGPGLAGVASKAGGHSIKKINDQDDYSLWEFYYDPSKDAGRQLAGAQAALQGNQAQRQNQNQTFGFSQNSSFNSTTNSSTNSSQSPQPQSPTLSTGSGPQTMPPNSPP